AQVAKKEVAMASSHCCGSEKHGCAGVNHGFSAGELRPMRSGAAAGPHRPDGKRKNNLAQHVDLAGARSTSKGATAGETVINNAEETMRFICLGYADEKTWDAMSPKEQSDMMEECFAFDEVLHKGGHWVGAGEALQSARIAKTLRWKNGK